MKALTDKQKWHAMKKLGVKWTRKQALPTYRARMTIAQKAEANTLYDSMSEEFVASFGRIK